MADTRVDGHDLRCVCARRPLLARYGRATDGSLFVHIKVFKQSRLYTEAIFTDGTVRIHCRECLRWNKIIIRQPSSVRMRAEALPDSIRV
jgi:hypothetical protein